ncbi:amidohydrolase family protein [Alkalihalobacillus trypoxylicola]|nr:amidohydrolase family protein [Alkalihalobacillus trypoxylicola]
MLDQLFLNVGNPDFVAPMNIGIKNGEICYLRPHKESPPLSKKQLDVKNKIILPSLVESHIHLEKAFMLHELPKDITSLKKAIEETAKLKETLSKEEIKSRCFKVLEKSLRYGVTKMRAQVEIDPFMELRALETIVEVKEEIKHLIDLQIVAFPQEGIFFHENMELLMETAMEQGADVVGGITYNDRNLHEHLNFTFQLAKKYNADIDLHTDFSDNPEELAILDVIKWTNKYKMQGRVSVGHLTSLASIEQKKARAIAVEIAKSGITVIALPLTDFYLNGRKDEQAVRRGVTPVKLLLEEGVNVIYGSNNIQNAFTPYGEGNPIDAGALLAQVHYFYNDVEMKQLLDMITYKAANALGFNQYGLKLGHDADLAMFDTTDYTQIILSKALCEAVYRKGELVASTTVTKMNKLDIGVGSVR